MDRETYRRGLSSRVEHGQVKQWAEVVGVAPNSVSRQLNQTGYALPDCYEVAQVARRFQVDPAWLAFGLGVQDPELAACGQRLAQELAEDPKLGLVIEAWLASPTRRHSVNGWAKDMIGRPGLMRRLSARALDRGFTLSDVELLAVRASDAALPAVRPERAFDHVVVSEADTVAAICTRLTDPARPLPISELRALRSLFGLLQDLFGPQLPLSTPGGISVDGSAGDASSAVTPGAVLPVGQGGEAKPLVEPPAKRSRKRRLPPTSRD